MQKIQANIEVSKYGTFRVDTKGKISEGKYSLILTVHEKPKNDNPPQKGLIVGEITSTFAELLWKYMDRINATASSVAERINHTLKSEKITITSESINKWRDGKSGKDSIYKKRTVVVPEINNKNYRILVVCADFLRLSDEEKYLFLKTAGFEEHLDLPETIFIEYINEFFDSLSKEPVIALFTQSGWGHPPLLNAILTKAKKKYYFLIDLV
ncbi:hypothetical protein QUF50_10470 [Thiotrichales bacterium HSG1]|nr:hypothetical protein [Thiotrichales bacterium HSG1]